MRVLVCIDDTDNLESKGTGDLATGISDAISKFGWGECLPVSRHQLLVHSDIPYTSHNSSMCFVAEVQAQYVGQLIDYASSYLLRESAEGSDPGLCVVCAEQITNPEQLISFGNRAKNEILTKDDAYKVAKSLGIHLSEHGGTGQGIIGALAGAGLRLGGNDGRIKGKLKKNENNTASVREILGQTVVEQVQSLDGVVLNNEEQVILGDWVKAILRDGMIVLPVYKAEESGIPKWLSCTKQQLRQF